MSSNRRFYQDDNSSIPYRLSSEERAKEILEKYKKPSQSIMSSADSGLPMNSLRSEWEKLMESEDLDEMDSPMKPDKHVEVYQQDHSSSSLSSEAMYSKSQSPRSKSNRFDISQESSNDSLDLSDTDLQVGAYAKKLAEEKANDRKLRMSAESVTYSDKNPSPHITASPQAVTTSRSIRKDVDKYLTPFVGTSTISSIINSDDEKVYGSKAQNDLVRFGSVGQSDGDLLNTLTGASKKSSTGDSSRSGSNSVYDYHQRRGSLEDSPTKVPRNNVNVNTHSVSNINSYENSATKSKVIYPIESKSTIELLLASGTKSMNKIPISQQISTNKINNHQKKEDNNNDDDDDEVYSFNEFEDNQDDEQESPNNIPILHRAYSDDIARSRDSKHSLHDSVKGIQPKQSKLETVEEKERRESIEAIWSRWSSIDQKHGQHQQKREDNDDHDSDDKLRLDSIALSEDRLESPIPRFDSIEVETNDNRRGSMEVNRRDSITEGMRENMRDDSRDDHSDAFTNKSGGRTEDITPLNDLDNFSAGSDELSASSVPKPSQFESIASKTVYENKRNNKKDLREDDKNSNNDNNDNNSNSISPLDISPLDVSHVVDDSKRNDRYVDEPEMDDPYPRYPDDINIEDSNIIREDVNQENLSNLIISPPSFDHRLSYKAATRYSEVDEEEKEEKESEDKDDYEDSSNNTHNTMDVDIYSPPEYESNHISNTVEAFSIHRESQNDGEKIGEDMDYDRYDEEEEDKDNIAYERETYPSFLKKKPNPEAIAITAVEMFQRNSIVTSSSSSKPISNPYKMIYSDDTGEMKSENNKTLRQPLKGKLSASTVAKIRQQLGPKDPTEVFDRLSSTNKKSTSKDKSGIAISSKISKLGDKKGSSNLVPKRGKLIPETSRLVQAQRVSETGPRAKRDISPALPMESTTSSTSSYRKSPIGLLDPNGPLDIIPSRPSSAMRSARITNKEKGNKKLSDENRVSFEDEHSSKIPLSTSRSSSQSSSRSFSRPSTKPSHPSDVSSMKARTLIRKPMKNMLPKPKIAWDEQRKELLLWEEELRQREEDLQTQSEKLIAFEEDLTVKEETLLTQEEQLRAQEEMLKTQEEESVMLHQQQQSFEEEVLLKQHITMLEDNMEDLKSKLFETIEERNRLKEDLFEMSQNNYAISMNPNLNQMMTEGDINSSSNNKDNNDTDNNQNNQNLHEGNSIYSIPIPLPQTLSNRGRSITAILIKPKLERNAAYDKIALDKLVSDNIGTDQVILSKKEFDELISERNSIEQLLLGYQKENEKLVQLLKKKELEDKTLKSQFYDQQEAMNKEMNRLRNLTNGITEETNHKIGDYSLSDVLPNVTVIRKSSSLLRSELDTDAAIRYLKEQLLEIQTKANAKEKELNETIDKIRKDYRQLVERSTEESSNLYNDFQTRFNQLEQENRVKSELITEYKRKIEWYVENQGIIDKIYEEKKTMQLEIGRLRKEVTRLGGNLPIKSTLSSSKPIIPSIRRLKEKYSTKNIDHRKGGGDNSNNSKDKDGDEEDMDHKEEGKNEKSLLENTSISLPYKSKRNLSDVKKIKELEETIKDLNETLQRRHPDSVSGIIRAASYADTIQQETIQKYQNTIDKLSKEINESKDEYQRNLRSLRQEYEQVKSKYDHLLSQSIPQSHNPLVSATTTTTQSSSLGLNLSPPSSRSTSAIRSKPMNFIQAQARIKELEEEMERVRKFYNKKIEELQRKIKEPSSNQKFIPSDTIPSSLENSSHVVSEDILNKIKAYEDRIVVLEQELSSKQNKEGNNVIYHEEKSALEEEEENFIINPTSNHSKSGNPSTSSTIPIDYWMKQLEQQHTIQLTHQMDTSSYQIQQLLRDREKLLIDSQVRYDTILSERQELWNQLKNEENRSNKLAMELEYIKKQLFDIKNTPVASQIQVMESQMNMLERRLESREKELRVAIEESRLAGKLELARLQGIHEQELREKDEELSKFQSQLELLISTLRRIQNTPQ